MVDAADGYWTGMDHRPEKRVEGRLVASEEHLENTDVEQDVAREPEEKENREQAPDVPPDHPEQPV
jgi:hypothetical protein